VVIHPVLAYNGDPQQWWQSATRDEGWWQSWFDRYQTFLLYHADLAAQTDAKTLVIGDETILPALPGGTLADGAPSGVPGDAADRWRDMLSNVRARYTGKIAWMVPYTGSLPPTPEFIKDDVDLLYVQMATLVTTADQPTQADLEASFTEILDTDILKLQEATNHSIILGLQFPSTRGALDGCVENEGTCLPQGAFQRPARNNASAELSFKDQALVYSAALTLVNQRSWITGFYAADFYAPVELKDGSTSIRSKPAGDVLWYWYPRLLGKVAP
jgi:hypothetical protein